MSFILDALNKADRERSLNNVPTFTTVHIPVYVTGRRVALWAVAAVLLGGAALAWWLLRPPTEAPVSTLQPRPSVAVNPPARPTDPTREPASGPVASVSPTVVPESAPPRPSVAPRPGAQRQADGDRTAGLRPTLPAPKPLPRPPSAPIQPEIRQTRPVEPDPPAVPSPRSELQPNVEASRPPSAVIPAAPPASPVPPAPRVQAQPNVEASRPPSVVLPIPAAPPPVSAAPPALQEALSKMTLDVFVYTDVEADRMAVINGRRYVKGQLVDGLYLVEGINPDGVVLRYRDERAVLRP